MMTTYTTMTPYLLYLWIATIFLVVLSYFRTIFRSGLRSLPGPFWAQFSGLYRLSLVHKGNGPENYRELHKKYGPMVRVGPSHVSVSDVAMLPVIYGIGSKFMKVSPVIETDALSKITDTFLHNNGAEIRGRGNG